MERYDRHSPHPFPCFAEDTRRAVADTRTRAYRLRLGLGLGGDRISSMGDRSKKFAFKPTYLRVFNV